MATAAQIEANRSNSQKSCGPKTEAGKAVSRGNSVKHGLAGEGIVLPPKLAQTVDERYDEWLLNLHPEDSTQEWLVRRICVESVRLDELERQEPALKRELALQAQETWELDHILAARLLMRKLPKQPELVQIRLLQTKQGCEAIIERWRHLGLRLEQKGAWEPDDWSSVLDLLGIAIDERIFMRPSAKQNLEWVAGQVAQLQSLLGEVLEPRDDRERLAAQAGQPIFLAPELKNHRRYESTCQNRLKWACNELKAAQVLPVDLPAGSPASAPPAAEAQPEIAAAPPSSLESKSTTEEMFKPEKQVVEQADTLTSFDLNSPGTEPFALPQAQRPKAPADQRRKAKKARRAQAKARARARRSS